MIISPSSRGRRRISTNAALADEYLRKYERLCSLRRTSVRDGVYLRLYAPEIEGVKGTSRMPGRPHAGKSSAGLRLDDFG